MSQLTGRLQASLGGGRAFNSHNSQSSGEGGSPADLSRLRFLRELNAIQRGIRSAYKEYDEQLNAAGDGRQHNRKSSELAKRLSATTRITLPPGVSGQHPMLLGCYGEVLDQHLVVPTVPDNAYDGAVSSS